MVPRTVDWKVYLPAVTTAKESQLASKDSTRELKETREQSSRVSVGTCLRDGAKPRKAREATFGSEKKNGVSLNTTTSLGWLSWFSRPRKMPAEDDFVPAPWTPEQEAFRPGSSSAGLVLGSKRASGVPIDTLRAFAPDKTKSPGRSPATSKPDLSIRRQSTSQLSLQSSKQGLGLQDRSGPRQSGSVRAASPAVGNLSSMPVVNATAQGSKRM
jgi:hypothetical protein